ncbi:hypothetical protein SAMN02745883_01761 [Caminicella sporogenes DSM 14501]|uniref:Uncharacterized protein n=1 Tax=Caminicella sporogenes DSM 14501 TaxID=1121266 RepID=A0A1M6RE43_9FIRM|nr:hypothetical protein [Caminicella sporogenes]RKD25209.1 hypothetical protein BET04_03035 [Caminicella sporogenes]SHK30761.1 hypothetical protein SAMN02745883_01761 [Caminicella sporogenes DSM 14501]
MMYNKEKVHIMESKELSVKIPYLTLIAAFAKEINYNKFSDYLKHFLLPKNIIKKLDNIILNMNRELIFSAKEEIDKYKHILLIDMHMIYFDSKNFDGDGKEVLKEFARIFELSEEELKDINKISEILYEDNYSLMYWIFEYCEWINEETFNYIYNLIDLDKADKRLKNLIKEQKEKWIKINRIKKVTNNSEVIENYKYVVFSNKELNDLEEREIKENGGFFNKTVYLCGDEFEIRKNEPNKNWITYIGINEPKVYLVGEKEQIMSRNVYEEEGLVFDCTCSINFRNVYLTSKNNIYLYIDKSEDNIVDCRIDEKKITVIDPHEEMSEFLDEFIPEFERRGLI